MDGRQTGCQLFQRRIRKQRPVRRRLRHQQDDALPRRHRRIFYHPDDPRYEPFYEEIEWSVSESLPNTIELYNPRIELEAPTANYDQHAARTTLELLSYRKGLFVMKGMQPFAYWGGRTSDGIYYDYCLISGKLVTDRETDQHLPRLRGIRSRCRIARPHHAPETHTGTPRSGNPARYGRRPRQGRPSACCDVGTSREKRAKRKSETGIFPQKSYLCPNVQKRHTQKSAT